MAKLTSEDWSFIDGTSAKDSNPNYLCVITCNSLNISLTANMPQDFSIDLGAQYEEAMAQAVASNSTIAELTSKARLAGIQLTTQALTAQVWQGSTDVTFSIPLVFQIENDENTDILKPLMDLYTLVLPDDTDGGFLKAPGPSLSPELLGKAVGQFTSGVINSVVAAGGALDAVQDKVTEVISGTLSNYIPGVQQIKAPTAATADHTEANKVASSAKGSGPKNPLISAVKNNISLTLGNYMHFDSVVITNVSQTHQVQPVASGTMSRVDVQVTFKTFFAPTRSDIKNIFGKRG